VKLSVKATAIAAAGLWGSAMLLVTAANLLWPSYGSLFLELMSSIYSGYHPGTGISSVIVGTLYGVVDAGIAGIVFAWIYNLLAE